MSDAPLAVYLSLYGDVYVRRSAILDDLAPETRALVEDEITAGMRGCLICEHCLRTEHESCQRRDCPRGD